MKNIIISALGAALAIRIIPWFAETSPLEQTGIFAGIFVPLIIFCFFCEEMAEKWRKYRGRVQEITELLLRLKGRKEEQDA
ncbi:MAG: hypothetical protein NC399_02855 [Muribaculum sp.]|nr:hypothetical protein [Muribaculum sp.]